MFFWNGALLAGACALGLTASLKRESFSSDKPRIIILLGAPGAGKGSQAVRLSQALDLPHISTGDLYRENIRNETPLGLEAKAHVESGRFAPDSLTINMLFDRVGRKDCSKGYILDGFPRTLPQAEAYHERLGDTSDVLVVNLKVPDSIITDRITGRLMCSGCGASYHIKNKPPKFEGICDSCQTALSQRKDDSAEVVKERLRVYHELTLPLEEYYEKRQQLITINGEQSFDRVFEELLNVVSEQINY